MRRSIAFLAVLSWVPASIAADKKLPLGEATNQLVDISATAIVDKDEILKEIGSDPRADIMVVRVTFRPVSDKPIQIDLDDFLLVSNKDGQRSQPFAPSQLAGDATLVVTPQTTRVVTNGTSLGIPGIGGISRRSKKQADDSQNNSTAPADAEPKAETANSDKENPLLAALTAKCLPEKEVTDPVTGLLYFQSVGTKLKPKDLELHYKGPGGRLAMRFGP